MMTVPDDCGDRQIGLRSVFRSLDELQIYAKLKERYLFVYPRVPLCAVVSTAHVKDLIEQPWQQTWFLTYEFDFVVCNREGVPLKVIELGAKSAQSYEQELIVQKFLERLSIPKERE